MSIGNVLIIVIAFCAGNNIGALINILRQRKNHRAHLNPGLATRDIVPQPSGVIQLI
ncbi:MAG: hypothetical protein ACLFQS_03390 [Bacteroidales bacterium]